MGQDKILFYRIIDKLCSFFEIFEIFILPVGGFILIVGGCELIKTLSGSAKYTVAMAVLFMSFGIFGRMLKNVNS